MEINVLHYIVAGIAFTLGIIVGAFTLGGQDRYFKSVIEKDIDGVEREKWIEVDLREVI